MGGKGFLGGMIWGIAIYLVFTYVWPKIKGTLDKGGGSLLGGEAVAYPAFDPATMTTPGFPGVPGAAGAPGATGIGGGGVIGQVFPNSTLPMNPNKPDWNAFTQCHENCRQGCMAMIPGLARGAGIAPSQPLPMPMPPTPASRVTHANLANYDPYNVQANRLLGLSFSPYLGLGRYGN